MPHSNSPKVFERASARSFFLSPVTAPSTHPRALALYLRTLLVSLFERTAVAATDRRGFEAAEGSASYTPTVKCYFLPCSYSSFGLSPHSLPKSPANAPFLVAHCACTHSLTHPSIPYNDERRSALLPLPPSFLLEVASGNGADCGGR